jgi:hypothetical protein
MHLSWVLVRQEGLPAPVGCIVPPNEFHLLWLHLVVDVLDPRLTRAHIPDSSSSNSSGSNTSGSGSSGSGSGSS